MTSTIQQQHQQNTSASACCLTPIRSLSPAQTADIFLHTTPGSPHPQRHTVLGGDDDDEEMGTSSHSIHMCFSFDSEDSLFLPTFNDAGKTKGRSRIEVSDSSNAKKMTSSPLPSTLHLKPRSSSNVQVLRHSPRDAKRENDPSVASLTMDHLFLH